MARRFANHPASASTAVASSWSRHLALWLVVAVVASVNAKAATHPPLTTKGGAVSSDQTDASIVGARILASGGNAMDAAAATALTLGVINPSSSGIGGGGFAVVYDARTKKVHAIDFREIAPAALSTENFVVDGKLDVGLARSGGLAVGVPGEVAGLARLQTLGTLPWAKVVEPSQRLAERGFKVGWFFALAAKATLGLLPEGHAFREFLTPGGVALHEGMHVRRSGLAKTLKAIARKGPAAFYGGAIADDIIATVQAGGGVMTKADLKSYQVVDREPLIGTWGKYRVATMPLPSSGGLIALALFGILDSLKVDLAKTGPGSSETLHWIAEVLKHGFADRARLLGDAKPASEMAKTFLDPDRLRALAAKVGRRTRRHNSYGDKKLGKQVEVKSDDGTSHLCVIDKDGNAVALTTTVNGYFGAKAITKTSGVVLNNQIDDFSIRSGVANQFGLVQSNFNLVGPGKRPLSSMTPILIFDGDKVIGCAGGSGGPRIISNTIQVLLNIFVHKMNVREAVEAPRIHHQWSPNELLVEKQIPSDVVRNLRKRGHVVVESTRPTAVQAIIVDADGVRHAASDPRKAGTPAAAPQD